MNHILFTFASLCINLGVGCFITDCPEREKRPSDQNLTVGKVEDHNLLECSLCGPSLRHYRGGQDEEFRCFGQSLCCSPADGCLRLEHTDYANNCIYERHSSCINQGQRCYMVNNGRCATDGLCCNYIGQCFRDPKCNLEEEPAPQLTDTIFYKKMLRNLREELIRERKREQIITGSDRTSRRHFQYK